MARYIDIDKVKPDCISTKGGVAVSQSQLASQPTADVIEREKYEKALEEIENLRYISEKNDSLCNDLAQAFNKIDELKKGIDKAIEEIKEESYLSYDDNPRHILDEECVLEIIEEVLAKN